MQEYPKWRIHTESGAERVFRTAEEESAVGSGWGGQVERLNFLAANEDPPDEEVVNIPANGEMRPRRRGRPPKNVAVTNADSA